MQGRTSFFTSILGRCPPFAAPQWCSWDLDWESIGSMEKGLRDAGHRIHWQKEGPDASLTPTPRSLWMRMNFCEWEANLHKPPCGHRTFTGGRVCGRRQTTTTTRVACQGSSFSFVHQSRGGAVATAGGGLKGWVVDKKTPVGGSPLALAWSQWM